MNEEYKIIKYYSHEGIFGDSNLPNDNITLPKAKRDILNKISGLTEELLGIESPKKVGEIEINIIYKTPKVEK